MSRRREQVDEPTSATEQEDLGEVDSLKVKKSRKLDIASAVLDTQQDQEYKL